MNKINTSPIQACVKTNIKTEAEAILANLNLTPSEAIGLFYKEVIHSHGLPFDARLPQGNSQPIAINSMNKAQIDQELTKGLASLRTDLSYDASEIQEEFNRKKTNA